MKQNLILWGMMTALTSIAMGAWTNTLDVTIPAGSETIASGDDRIKELKLAIIERMNDRNGTADAGDHYWPTTANNISDAQVGEHRKLTFQSPISKPTPSSNEGFLYTKTVNSVPELHWEDKNANEVQLTTGGKILLSGEYDQALTLSSTSNVFNAAAIAMSDAGVFTLPDDTTDTTEGNIKYNTTSDSVQFRDASAWVTLAATTGLCKIKTGSYTGDGAGTKAITGVGFQPTVVLVIAPHGTNNYIKTLDMTGTNAKCLSSNTVSDDSIRSLDADGFTVGDGTGGSGDDEMNVLAGVYYYIALQVMP